MMYSVNTFKQFLNDIKSETRDIYTIQPTEVDTYLQEFFIGIRKQTKNENDESEYQPGTLSGFHGMINRYLSLNGYTHDIMKYLTFKKSRDCLMAKEKHLEELGLGNLPDAAEDIESDEEKRFLLGHSELENRQSPCCHLYKSHRPPAMCSPESPFYLGVNRSVKAKCCKLANLESKSKVTKSEKATTAANPESNPESYININVEEIKTALNERPESAISSTGNRSKPFEFLPKGTVINGRTFNFVFGSNDWDPNNNQKENISPPEPKRRRAMVIYSNSE
ncbi:unnamed protein product [Mytilus coruscus]|uniref:Uncharacterized protein n=1 Tax=Mytilus coruscus TaxID=42192 RepID=A0A6J8BJE1_MYTCO|nr:unnamed protein product [Mytilus coruscus]